MATTFERWHTRDTEASGPSVLALPSHDPRESSAGLPPAFDTLGYELANPDLTFVLESHAAIHYLQTGRKEGRHWRRPFSAAFYSDLYLNGRNRRGDDSLRKLWTAAPSTYGTLREALLRNGFRSDTWVAHFDVRSYIEFNTLGDQLKNATQGIVHFVEHGWRNMLAMSESTQFSPSLYRELVDTRDVPDHELYRRWIQIGLPLKAPANETAQLRLLGIDLPCYPVGFDWRTYLSDRSDAIRGKCDRWSALEHLAETGVLEDCALPVQPDGLESLLGAVANRFYLTGRSAAAAKVYDLILVLVAAPDPRIVHRAADLAMHMGQQARALALYREIRNRSQPQFKTSVNAGTCALDIGLLDEADEWLREGLVRFPRNSVLRELHFRLQRRRFATTMSHHKGRVLSGVASTDLDASLTRIFDSYIAAGRAEFGVPAKRTGRSPGPLRIAFLANQDLPQCTFYRVAQKAEQLVGRDLVLTTIAPGDVAAFQSALATADIALFYRVASTSEVLRCIAACRVLDIPTVYDVDDLVFHPDYFPERLESYAGTITVGEHTELRAGVSLFRHALRLCDVGMASTMHLGKYLRTEVHAISRM